VFCFALYGLGNEPGLPTLAGIDDRFEGYGQLLSDC
jgi:hypothetical protein